MEPSVNAPQQPNSPSVAPPSAPPAGPPQQGPGTPKGLAVAALVLGIIAFLFGWFGLLNLPVAIAAVVIGIIALNKKQPKGLALTGLILGAIGLLTSLIIGLVFGAAFLRGVNEGLNNSTVNNSQSTTQESTSDSTAAWDVEAAYAKIENGMSKSEVEAATGKTSTSCAESTSQFGKIETCTYGTFEDKASISVVYTDDVVSSKSKYKF